MYENEYMYAIERNGDYLAHYGIKGMKWGVRKAIERGNSRALSRQYAKAQKKLAKLEKRAANGKKYAKRAAALGAGAAAAGGLAAVGTAGVANASRFVGRAGHGAMDAAGRGMLAVGNKMKQLGIRGGGRVAAAGLATRNASTGVGLAGRNAGRAIENWGKSNSLASDAVRKYGTLGLGKASNAAEAASQAAKYSDRVKKAGGITNNTIARIGAGAVGAGLAAGAGYNAYRAATTKRAARKAAEFRKAMNESFRGTQYANGAPRQGNRKKRRR